MSFRSLRAAEAVSSSASTTIRPPTMCSPPANLNVADTSALRQQGLVTVSRLSSALTIAVIAMRAILSLVSGSRGQSPRAKPPQLLRPPRRAGQHLPLVSAGRSSTPLMTARQCLNPMVCPRHWRIPRGTTLSSFITSAAPQGRGVPHGMDETSVRSAHDVAVCGGQAQRVMVAFPVLGSHMGNDQLCAHPPGRTPQQRLVPDDLGVGQHNVQVQVGSMKREDLKV